jgi:hypothetical protein
MAEYYFYYSDNLDQGVTPPLVLAHLNWED